MHIKMYCHAFRNRITIAAESKHNMPIKFYNAKANQTLSSLMCYHPLFNVETCHSNSCIHSFIIIHRYQRLRNAVLF